MNHLTDEQINEYVDQLLTPAQAEEVERHLLGCLPCQSRVDELEQVFSALADLPEVLIKKDLSASVLRQIAPAPMVLPERRPSHALPRWVSVLTWTLAALQIPLAGLAVVYAFPRIQAWLTSWAPYHNLAVQWLSPVNRLSTLWIASEIIESIMSWGSQVQRAFENLYSPSLAIHFNPQEATAALTALLAIWVVGNYLLFRSNRKFAH